MAAKAPAAEANAIIRELRVAGHELWSWGESSDFTSWGDDYANPPAPTRFIIELRWPDPEDASPVDFEVVVTFGPWPK